MKKSSARCKKAKTWLHGLSRSLSFISATSLLLLCLCFACLHTFFTPVVHRHFRFSPSALPSLVQSPSAWKTGSPSCPLDTSSTFHISLTRSLTRRVARAGHALCLLYSLINTRLPFVLSFSSSVFLLVGLRVFAFY